MWEYYNYTLNERIRPNVYAYNIVMAYFARLGQAVKFEHLLLEVLEHEGSKDKLLRTNDESFSLVIKSWIKNDASRYR